MRPLTLPLLAFFCWGFNATVGSADEFRGPNVVFILSDDHNTDTLACYGGKTLTPNLDRLAREGARLTRYYVTSSMCTPSRYAALTGQYASRCESPRFLRQNPLDRPAMVGFNVSIRPGDVNLGALFQKAGYVTSFTGKWHTGGPEFEPIDPAADLHDPAVGAAMKRNHEKLCDYIKSCGFDVVNAVYRGNLADHKLEGLTDHNPEWLTASALAFIEANRDREFFLHVCPTLLHGPSPRRSLESGDPLMTPAGFLAEPPRSQPSRESVRKRVADAGLPPTAAPATWLDDGVGAILRKLDELGIAENTVVIFAADNGLASGKFTNYDGGARVPALVRAPGYVPAGVVCDRLAANVDWLPTLAEICGLRVPESYTRDGASLLPLLNGRGEGWREDLVLEAGYSRAVVDARWKYIALRFPPAVEEGLRTGRIPRPFGAGVAGITAPLPGYLKVHPALEEPDQLYDLPADPREARNLADDASRAETLAERKARLGALLRGFPRPYGDLKP